MQMTLRSTIVFAICLIISIPANVCMSAEWQIADIGPDAKSDVQIHDGRITINAATGDAWGAADSTVFVYQEINGDAELFARVTEYVPSEPQWGKAGPMIRQSIDADSANAFLILTQDNGLKLNFRVTKAGPTGPDAPTVPYQLPYYFGMRREGNLITAITSKDGIVWKDVGGGTGPSVEIKMTDAILIGFGVAAKTQPWKRQLPLIRLVGPPTRFGNGYCGDGGRVAR